MKRSFETGMERLDEIAALLDGGEIELESAVALFEEGKKLALEMEAILEKAERKLTMAPIDPSGEKVNTEKQLKAVKDLPPQKEQDTENPDTNPQNLSLF